METNSARTMQRIRSLNLRGILVPLKFTLGTSAAVVKSVPLLLVDLSTEDGVTGRAYTFCYRHSGARAIAGHLKDAVDLLEGRDVTAIEASQLLGRQFALLGVTGSVRMALSLLDMALWDAIAQVHQVPLAVMLGGRPQALKAYDSRGLGLMKEDELRREVGAMLSLGLKAVKLRLGYPTVEEDLKAFDAIRKVVPDDVAIMVDYNQALSPAQAHERGRRLDERRVTWIEEPITHDAYDASAVLARELNTPIQIGENFNGPGALLKSISSRASDFVMPDVARIGGVTGWIHAAGVAAAAEIQMSSHLMPEISAQLMSATPTAHWLEYVDWADAILQEPLKVVDGRVEASDNAGSGLVWDDEKISRLQTI